MDLSTKLIVWQAITGIFMVIIFLMLFFKTSKKPTPIPTQQEPKYKHKMLREFEQALPDDAVVRMVVDPEGLMVGAIAVSKKVRLNLGCTECDKQAECSELYRDKTIKERGILMCNALLAAFKGKRSLTDDDDDDIELKSQFFSTLLHSIERTKRKLKEQNPEKSVYDSLDELLNAIFGDNPPNPSTSTEDVAGEQFESALKREQKKKEEEQDEPTVDKSGSGRKEDDKGSEGA